MNRLPGSPYEGSAPEAFEPRAAWVARLERDASGHALPVRTHSTVTSVEPEGAGFAITTEAERILARSVIVASGTINAPKLPVAATLLDHRIDLPDPAMQFWAQPQLSGVGPLGHTVSLQSLAGRGATLLGHFEGADGTRARFAADLAQHVGFADDTSKRMRLHVDEHIARHGIAAPAADPDPADEPVTDAARFTAPTELDLLERGIRSVIFSTGFSADFSWLRCPVLDDRGAPVHLAGRSPIDGIWFLGFPWLRTRKSGIVWGALDDSVEIVRQVVARRERPGR